MLQLIVRILLNALAVMAVAYFVPGVTVRNFWSAVLAAIVIGLVNALIRPVLSILSLPITILTLGLFTLILNALMFWLASVFVPGFDVNGFGAAFWGSVVFWLVSWITNGLIAAA